MNLHSSCTNLNGLLSTERAAIHFHLDAHILVEPAVDRREAVRAFIEGYGGLMRELYCAYVCHDRAHCEAVRSHHVAGLFAPQQAS